MYSVKGKSLLSEAAAAVWSWGGGIQFMCPYHIAMYVHTHYVICNKEVAMGHSCYLHARV